MKLKKIVLTLALSTFGLLMFTQSADAMSMDHSKINHGSEKITLKKAQNAKYKNGSKIMIKANHMSGMKGAMGSVAQSYKTNLYTVTYKSTKTGKMVKNHEYLVNGEFSGKAKTGAKVTIKTNHMSGMKGAKATINKVTKGPAYVVNYTSNDSSHMKMKNHKWLAQNEISKMK